ncbi:MAG: ABC transporter substrate-binding protein [Clostridia bacterium]|nr:ABC transporter substrate-binding protein [Clostridia bacterium]
MKRILCLLLALFLLLPLFTACAPEEDVIRVGVLNGPTAMGALKMMKDADPRYEFKIYKTPADIRADLEAGELDIAALPTNNAATFYNLGMELQVIALNTLGVLHIVDATGTVTTLEDLEGKTVYVPNAGSNPEYILRHILAEQGINATVKTDLTDPSLIQSALINGTSNEHTVEIAALPQPAATATVVKAKSQGKTITTPIDLSVEWNEVESTPIAQGCLVATKKLLEKSPDAVEDFLAAYETSVAYMTASENLESAAALVVEYEILAATAIAKLALPKCAITYMDGGEMKATLEAFYTILHGYNPAAIGGKIPSSDFYYE